MSTFKELIYSNSTVSDAIVKQWPQAKITDARDSVHDECFEVEIEGVGEDEFYIFAVKNKFLRTCFLLRLAYERLSAEKVEKLKAQIARWKQREEATER